MLNAGSHSEIDLYELVAYLTSKNYQLHLDLVLFMMSIIKIWNKTEKKNLIKLQYIIESGLRTIFSSALNQNNDNKSLKQKLKTCSLRNVTNVVKINKRKKKVPLWSGWRLKNGKMFLLHLQNCSLLHWVTEYMTN
jgi:hypothetical protein